MAKVTASAQAQADFDTIYDYWIEAAGAAVADQYARDIRASINQLAYFPQVGAVRFRHGPEIRAVIVKPYLIFYEFSAADDQVVITRILHGHRRITADMMRGRF